MFEGGIKFFLLQNYEECWQMFGHKPMTYPLPTFTMFYNAFFLTHQAI